MANSALALPRSEIIQKVKQRIRLAKEMQSRDLQSAKDFETYRSDAMRWWNYNKTMLRTMFTDGSVAEEYSSTIPLSINEDWQHCSFLELKDSVAHQAAKLQSLLEQLDFYPEAASTMRAAEEASPAHRSSKVFLVHGHDEGARESAARFLERLGLTAVILAEQPNRGRTVIEKFVDCAREVGFAVVLLTPDDLDGAAADEAQKSRARQNVIFELGYFVGSLGRGRACLLRKGEVEIPSDLYGVVYTTMDSGNGWKIGLARELKAAGFQFDANKVVA